MSDAADDTANVRDGSEFDPGSSASRVGEPGSSGLAPVEPATSAEALMHLLRLGPDAVIDQLCEGRPRDFRTECALHVADCAYFIEDGRVAARVIATLATMACDRPGATSRYEPLETIVEESTAAILEEGSLPLDAALSAPPCQLTARIGLVLGLDEGGAHGLIDALNSFGFEDRHVLYQCIVRGLTPEQYAREFEDDARIAAVMLRNVASMAIDGKTDGSIGGQMT